MNVFIIGITGGIGDLLAQKLRCRGATVRGLVRRAEQKDQFTMHGGDADAIVFSAGSNGGSKQVTKTIDRDGVAKAIEAAGLAGVKRFTLVSVFPESWRERDLGEVVEYYFTLKKEADIALSRSGLDWLILRPSLLVDGPGTGAVSLGPAELHGKITRADVAETLVGLLHEPRITRQILELTTGSTSIEDAVRANVR
jgi:uncharacterized protein YbjT (DUF2867 family)